MTTKVDPELIEDGAPNTIVGADGNGDRVDVPLTSISTRVGLTLESDFNSKTETTLTINPGKITHQDGTRTIELPAVLTKDVLSTFTPGDGNGCWDVAPSFANNQGVAVYIIENNSTKVTDILIAEARSTPVIPGGWSLARRIGYIMMNTNPGINGFIQRGNRFIIKDDMRCYEYRQGGTFEVVATLSPDLFPDDATLDFHGRFTLLGGNGGAFCRGVQIAGSDAPPNLRLMWAADSNVGDCNSFNVHDFWMHMPGNTILDVYIRGEYNGFGAGTRGFRISLYEWIDHGIQ